MDGTIYSVVNTSSSIYNKTILADNGLVPSIVNQQGILIGRYDQIIQPCDPSTFNKVRRTKQIVARQTNWRQTTIKIKTVVIVNKFIG